MDPAMSAWGQVSPALWRWCVCVCMRAYSYRSCRFKWALLWSHVLDQDAETAQGGLAVTHLMP